MDVKLTIYSDDKQYFSHAVKLPCVIGRARQCGVSIVHPLVSRQHCEIYEEKGQVYVRDLGSLDGTIFQGVRIGRGVHVPYGSAFSIGGVFFLIEAADATSQTTDSIGQVSSEVSHTSEEIRLEMDRRVSETLNQIDPSGENQDSKNISLESGGNANDPFTSTSGIELDDLASDGFDEPSSGEF